MKYYITFKQGKQDFVYNFRRLYDLYLLIIHLNPFNGLGETKSHNQLHPHIVVLDRLGLLFSQGGGEFQQIA